MVAWEATALPLGNTRGVHSCCGELELRRRIIPRARSAAGRSRAQRWRPRAARFAPALHRKARPLRFYLGELEAGSSGIGYPAAAATRPSPPASLLLPARLSARIQAHRGLRGEGGIENPPDHGFPGRAFGRAGLLCRSRPTSGAIRIFSSTPTQ